MTILTPNIITYLKKSVDLNNKVKCLMLLQETGYFLYRKIATKNGLIEFRISELRYLDYQINTKENKCFWLIYGLIRFCNK